MRRKFNFEIKWNQFSVYVVKRTSDCVHTMPMDKAIAGVKTSCIITFVTKISNFEIEVIGIFDE